MKIGMAFWTNHSQVSIGFRIPFNLPKPSILNGSEYAAAIPTPVAEGWDACDRGLFTRVNPILKVEEFTAQSKTTHASCRCL